MVSSTPEFVEKRKLFSGGAGRSRQAGTSGIQRDSEWEPTGALHHLGVRFDCPSGGREAKASR